jgi:hypothetical protein
MSIFGYTLKYIFDMILFLVVFWFDLKIEILLEWVYAVAPEGNSLHRQQSK